jgi:hypothetical protein
VGLAILPDLHYIYPGLNNLSAIASLTALNSRPELEKLLSAYVFGISTPVSLHIIVNDPSFIAPAYIQYDFILPDKTGKKNIILLTVKGGNYTQVIQCIDLADINIGIDSDNWDCTVSVDANAWFHNPLPFPIRMMNVSYDLYFRDPYGVVVDLGLIEDTLYPPSTLPLNDFYFGHVTSPTSTGSGTATVSLI